MKKNEKIYISGHSGMVGSSLASLLERQGYNKLIFKTHQELDLRNQKKVEKFIKDSSPDYVFLFAAKVGGIKANISYPGDFLYDNLMIESNLIHACLKFKVKKLLYLGSSCIYPRECPQPMKEEYLLTGKLEPTNEGYALAKIAGLKLCEYFNKQFKTNFISLMPPNLYGENDNFNPDTSHVVAALIKKFVDAKNKNLPIVEIWGTGNARREFMYVDDLADACVFFMNNYEAKDLPLCLNIGCGRDVTIKELVELIKGGVGFKGAIVWNTDMPDGMPRKFLDTGLLNKFGWKPKTSLNEGVVKAINWYIKNYGKAK